MPLYVGMKGHNVVEGHIAVIPVAYGRRFARPSARFSLLLTFLEKKKKITRRLASSDGIQNSIIFTGAHNRDTYLQLLLCSKLAPQRQQMFVMGMVRQVAGKVLHVLELFVAFEPHAHLLFLSHVAHNVVAEIRQTRRRRELTAPPETRQLEVLLLGRFRFHFSIQKRLFWTCKNLAMEKPSNPATLNFCFVI